MAAALDGEWLFITGRELVAGVYRNTVFVYRFDGSSWQEFQRIRPSGSQPSGGPFSGQSDDFGGAWLSNSIALHGSTALIGAPGEDGRHPDEGRVYEYQYTGGHWVEVATLAPPEPRWSAMFGASVDFADDRAVIGAHMSSWHEPFNPVEGPGRAYVYQREPGSGTWLLARRLEAPDANGARNWFGAGGLRLAKGGVVIGAPYYLYEEGLPPGAVYQFTCGADACAGVQSCSGGDGCCPAGCGPATDTDCGYGPLCTANHPCGNGEASCVSDLECEPGLSCGFGIGPRFGKPVDAGVCWDPSCDDPQSVGECGDTNARCGVCPGCVLDCSGRSCGPDGCGGSCGGACTASQAGCQSNRDCAEGLVCGLDNGARFGMAEGLRVCWPAVCESLDQASVPCGGPGADCGICPSCVPRCDGRNCGNNGCGGSCGACADGSSCELVTGMCTLPTLTRRFELQVSTEVTTAAVGTLPGRWAVSSSGSGTYDIPLELPPGRGGLQPELTLRYSSARGNGMLGVGWGLDGLSAVTRCDKTVAQDGFAGAPEFASDDAFCIDGQRLVEVSRQIDWTDQSAKIIYRTEDDRFARITGTFAVRPLGDEFVAFDGPNDFSAESKDGRNFFYGQRIPGYARTVDGVRRDPDTHVWALTRVSDRAANSMDVSYILSFRETEAGLVRDYYANTITYSDGIVVRFVYNFQSEYNEPRLDDPSGWRDGIQIRQEALLRRVSVRIDDVWVRHYELTYDAPAGSQPLTRLAQIQDCAGGDTPESSVCKPSTTFGYTPTPAALQAPVPVGTMGSLNVSVSAAPIVLDLNGDGLDDTLFAVGDKDQNLFVPADQTWTWYAALSQRQADGSVRHEVVNTGLVIGSVHWSGFFMFSDADISAVGSGAGAVLDWDNDGRQDLLEYDWKGEGLPREYTVVQFNGQTFTRFTTQIPQAEPTGTGDPNPGQPYVLDLNGDHFKDLLVCDWTVDGARWRMYLHQGGATGGITNSGNAAGFVEAQRRDLAIDAPCRNGGIILDKDGDGAEELLLPAGIEGRDAGFFVMLNTGGAIAIAHTNGVAGNPVSRIDAYQFPKSGVRVLDMNGDGLRDIVRYDLEGSIETYVPRVLIEINRGDGSFDLHEQQLDFSQEPSIRSWIMARSYAFDADLDGKDDLVLPLAGGQVPWISDGRFFARFGAAIAQTGDRPIDVNGDGIPGILSGSSYLERPLGPQAKLELIIDGFQAPTIFDYGQLTDPAVYAAISSTARKHAAGPPLPAHTRAER